MLKAEIIVNEPEVPTVAAWLGLPAEENMDVRRLSVLFNERSDIYIKKAEEWGQANNAGLCLSKLALSPHSDGRNSLKITAVVEKIDIYAAAKALRVPSPIAAIASKMSEKSFSGSLNTLLKLNKKMISNEAVKQFERRGIKIGSASVAVTAFDAEQDGEVAV